MSPLCLVALPEAEGAADPPGTPAEDWLARAQALADEYLELRPGVDWDDAIAHGGGPSLALGVERRSAPR